MDIGQDTNGRGIDYPEGIGEVERDLEKLCIFAAHVGEQSGDDVLCSFTSLLIAFIGAKVDLSPWFEEFLSENNVGFSSVLERRQIKDYEELSRIFNMVNNIGLPDVKKPMWSQSAQQLFEAALSIKQELNPNQVPILGTRHLMAAYAFRPPGAHLNQLEGWRFPIKEWRESFVSAMQGFAPSDENWNEFYFKETGLGPPDQDEDATRTSPENSKKPPAVEGSLIAGFDSDSADTDDLIGTEEEAKTFAKFVASRHFEPPMSIGLFGNWGVGKSFFMRKMQNHVEFLADESQIYMDENEATSVYHGRIVQIEFNAWHYIESNLWASLVDHIFTELYKYLSGTESREKHIDALFSGLTTVAELEKEARLILAHALRSERRSKKKLQEARDKYEHSVKEFRTATSEDIWQAVSKTFFESLGNNPTLQNNLKEAKQALALDKITDSAKALQSAIGEAQTVAGRGRLVVGSLIARTGSWWLWVIIAIAVIIIPYLADFLSFLVTKLPGELPGLHVVAANISAFLTAAGVILAGLTRLASMGIGKLETVDGLLQKAVEQKSEEHREALVEREIEVRSHESDVKRAESVLTDAVNQVGEARRELKEGSARARLSNFIKNRATSDDYRKHLGLIATIRRDFEALTEIMCDRGSEEEDEKMTKRFRRAEVDIDDIPTFDRIILYIDDLDRCPPKQVMEVLQAIHLLLAFKLFVVVVGVDARWMLGSVQDQYDRLLDDGRHDQDRAHSEGRDTGTDDTERAFEAVASPYDYLEKIFQIPYWLHAMNKGERKKFLGNIARRDFLEEETDRKPLHSDTEPDKVENSWDEPDKVDNPWDEPDRVDDPWEEPDRVDDPWEASAKGEKDSFDPYPKNVSIGEFEALFIERLSVHMTGSPRRAKRFVNLYRLIKMSLPGEKRNSLVESGKGESINYKILLIHLAIITAVPNIAPHFLEAFYKSQKSSGKFEPLANKLKSDLIGHRAFIEKNRLKTLLGEFDELGSYSSLKLDIMEWAEIVQRYSFRGEASWIEIDST